MRRVVFDDCVGWLHEAPGTTGVVLCPAVGHEAMWSYRGYRHLADDLASAGVPALRFDYPGTGDSAGIEENADCIGQWVHAIVGAAADLRARTGVSQVVLCGLRMGALLAVLAAETMAADHAGGPAGLVLLAPPVGGRPYLREVRALHMNWANNAVPDLDVKLPQDGSAEILGYRLPPEAVALLEALRLERRRAVPAPRVLLMDAWPGTASPVAALAAHYEAKGVRVTLGHFAEYPAMMQSPEYACVPEQAWQDIVQWLGPTAAVSRRARPSPVPEAEPLALPGAIEKPVWIGGNRQFGVLCVPAAAAPGGTVVLFPNTGGNHHVGDGRLFVTLSRRLARMGVSALRLDVAALGDSAQAARRMSIRAIYSPSPRDDVSVAVDWLHANGFQRIVLAGVCSGAFLGLHAALQNPAVDGVVLANILKFRWDPADDVSADDRVQSTRAYLAALRKGNNWKRFFCGEIHAWPHAVGLARKLARRTLARCQRAAAEETTVTGFARAAMSELNRRGVRIDLLYGAGDLGLDEAREHFGHDLGVLGSLANVHVRILPCLDHSLFLATSRDAFAAHVVRHVEYQQELAAGVAATPTTILPTSMGV